MKKKKGELREGWRGRHATYWLGMCVGLKLINEKKRGSGCVEVVHLRGFLRTKENPLSFPKPPPKQGKKRGVFET